MNSHRELEQMRDEDKAARDYTETWCKSGEVGYVELITDAYTVYALDFPGMGWSDIVPGASYEEPALRAAVVRVVEDLDLSDLTLAGESMGGTLSLTASSGSAMRSSPPSFLVATSPRRSSPGLHRNQVEPRL